MVRNLALTLQELTNNIIFALHSINISFNSLEEIAMNNLIASDFLFAHQSDLCAMANTSFCTCINETGKVGQLVHCLEEKLPGSLIGSSGSHGLRWVIKVSGFKAFYGPINCSYFLLCVTYT